MVTELRSAGSILIKEAAFFQEAAVLEKPKGFSPSVTQQSALSSPEVRVEPVKTAFSALSEIKDAAAQAAKSVREANKVLDNAAAVSVFSQTDPKSASDSQNLITVSKSQDSGVLSDLQNPKAASDLQGSNSTQADNHKQIKSSDSLTQEQIDYLARLNSGRAALRAQLEKLVGVLDVNLQQLVSESQAQIVANSVSGQLGIALQPLGSNSDALRQLKE